MKEDVEIFKLTLDIFFLILYSFLETIKVLLVDTKEMFNGTIWYINATKYFLLF